MNLIDLKSEIENDPDGMGYAQHVPHAPGVLADMLNAPGAGNVVREYWLTNRALVADIVPLHGTAMSDSILSKFEQAGASGKTIERMVSRLYNDVRGLNFGDAALRLMFSAWSGVVLTQAEADALLALPIQPGSRAEVLFGVDTVVTEAQITAALNLE